MRTGDCKVRLAEAIAAYRKAQLRRAGTGQSGIPATESWTISGVVVEL